MVEGATFRAICKTIDDLIKKGYDNFIIYPFGDIGVQVKQILNIRYGLQEFAIVDNILASYNPSVIASSELPLLSIPEKTAVIISTINDGLARKLNLTLPKFLPRQIIINEANDKAPSKMEDFIHPSINYKGNHVGKHTYGYHKFLSRMDGCVTIGNFCSINETAIIVENHPLDTVSTHTIFYNSQQMQALCKTSVGTDNVHSFSLQRGGQMSFFCEYRK